MVNKSLIGPSWGFCCYFVAVDDDIVVVVVFNVVVVNEVLNIFVVNNVVVVPLIAVTEALKGCWFCSVIDVVL